MKRGSYDCQGDPLPWDLDQIYKKPEKIRSALKKCEECPALLLCTRRTRKLLADGYVIQGVVQAGYVWLPQSTGSPKLKDDLKLELKRAGKIGSKKIPPIYGPLEREYV